MSRRVRLLSLVVSFLIASSPLYVSEECTYNQLNCDWCWGFSWCPVAG